MTKIMFCLAIVFVSAPVFAQQLLCTSYGPCEFTWAPNPEPDMKEYHFHMRGELGVYADTPDAVVPHPTTQTGKMTDTLSDGNYAAMVKAVDLAGNKSLASNELLFGVNNSIPEPPAGFDMLIIPAGSVLLVPEGTTAGP